MKPNTGTRAGNHLIIRVGSFHFHFISNRVAKPHPSRRFSGARRCSSSDEMKSRLAASIYLLTAGKCWINTRSTVSPRSIFAAFDRRHVQTDCSFHAQRFDSSNRGIHSSALEDDAFSELGPGESECSLKKIQLVSEKMDDFVNDDDAYSELDLDISKCSAKEIKSATEKLDAFSEDSFSELGPGLSAFSAKKLNLVTEKRDHIPKTTHSHRRESGSKLDSPDYRPDVKDLFEAISNASTTTVTKSRAPKKLSGATTKASAKSSIKLRAPVLAPTSTSHDDLASRPLSSNDRPNSKESSGATTKVSTTTTKLRAPVQVPTSTDDTKKEYPLSISIENIPFELGLPELIAAISAFGKVSGASFVTTSSKFKCCNIEFEDAESSRGAILAGKVKVGSHVFLVSALEALVTVRIENINKKTIDSAIHSICKSAGEFVGLARTCNNGVDAFFNVRDHTSHVDIVKRLNNTVLDHNHWSAHMLTSISNSSEVTSDKDARYELHSQINHQVSKLKMGFALKNIYLRDLDYLNACIMHIQDVPAASVQSG